MAVKIDIHITPDDMKVDASGFTGTACLDELDEMNAAMEAAGIQTKIGNQIKKGDHYEREQETVRH